MTTNANVRRSSDVTDLVNPDAVPGHNESPDWARLITDEMAREYNELELTTAALLKRARETVPAVITNDTELGVVTAFVVDMRDVFNRAEAYRKKEKEPHYRRGQAVDQFFNEIKERLEKGSGVVAARGHAFNMKKKAKEEARRAAEAAEARRIENEARAKAEAARLEAEQLAQAAARKRNAESKAEAERLAAEAAQRAEQARATASVAVQITDRAVEATEAKSADLVRTRHTAPTGGAGRLSTMRQEGYAEVTDYAALDLEALRPYLKRDALDAAVKAFGKATRHEQPLKGAEIGFRDASSFR